MAHPLATALEMFQKKNLVAVVIVCLAYLSEKLYDVWKAILFFLTNSKISLYR